MNSPRSGLGSYQKDAVIAAAILVVLLLLGRLLRHPEQLGASGPVLQKFFFGASGSALAGNSSGGGPPGNDAGHARTNESLSISTNPALQVVSKEQPADDGSTGDQSDPVKIIGTLPAELVDAPPPATNSADADALAERLNAAGAKSGDIQLSLLWNDYDDLDLHCFDPKGERIWYSHKRSEKTGGELDVDRNASEPFVASPIENIYWPGGGAPPGIYKAYIVYYAQHRDRGPQPIPYTVRVVVENQTNFLSGRISFTGRRELHWICTFQYDPTNPDPAWHRRFLANR